MVPNTGHEILPRIRRPWFRRLFPSWMDRTVVAVTGQVGPAHGLTDVFGRHRSSACNPVFVALWVVGLRLPPRDYLDRTARGDRDHYDPRRDAVTGIVAGEVHRDARGLLETTSGNSICPRSSGRGQPDDGFPTMTTAVPTTIGPVGGPTASSKRHEGKYVSELLNPLICPITKIVREEWLNYESMANFADATTKDYGGWDTPTNANVYTPGMWFANFGGIRRFDEVPEFRRQICRRRPDV